MLIAALGGEGGGVLTEWIVAAASEMGFPVQSTSIPGVAQRTGATTYYIEIFPQKTDLLGDKRPVMALAPGIGDVDIVIASELLEAGRVITNGFVTPDRTVMIASTSRLYTMDEKIAMGDGRFDQEKLIEAVRRNAKEAFLVDMDTLTRRSGSMPSAVMLGLIAGCGRLPITAERFESVIRADGKATDANLRGFRAGLEAVQARREWTGEPTPKKFAPKTSELVEHEVTYTLPLVAQEIAIEGVRRLIAYQGVGYAQLYLSRLRAINDVDQTVGGQGKLVCDVARQLAVRMSFEDVVRVAEVKISRERLRRIAQDELRANGEPFSVHDFLKPGIEELTQLLPPIIARPILWLAERWEWFGRIHFGMKINVTSISGYLRFLVLAKLKWLRPYGIRYQQEQEQIESWLDLVKKAALISIDFAHEVIECARLIKGYGDTHARGLANYRLIETRVIRPALAGGLPPAKAADAVASARTAALKDPEGESLAKCLAEIDARVPLPAAAE
ncbi:MAG: indolepyruvate oxidoreductase subunit beta family protein [Pseudolabrys sp.]|nr:indolepyruvate oxidoreductase subunit beta family protein [Pseudolabrys sp.]